MLQGESTGYILIMKLNWVVGIILLLLPIVATPQQLAAETHAAFSSAPLYQINVSASKPPCGITIGEYSTGQIFASWQSPGRFAAPGKYLLTGTAQLFIAIIHNPTDGNTQPISLYSSLANRFRIRLDYPDKTYEEVVSDFPYILHNCPRQYVESCVPYSVVPDPYEQCNPDVGGFIELVITGTGGSWDTFKKNVVLPLQSTKDWSPADVWLYLFRRVNKGYYAEVRISTNKCLRLVAEKLKGNPLILASNGRQMNIHYR